MEPPSQPPCTRVCHLKVKISFLWKWKMGGEKIEPFYSLNMGNILIFHLKPSNLHFFALTLYKGNSKKIQRKILKVSILKFWAVKPIQKWFYGIGLHSWGPDASFDTHIAISRHYKCQKLKSSFMSKMPKRPYLTHMPSDTCHL